MVPMMLIAKLVALCGMLEELRNHIGVVGQNLRGMMHENLKSDTFKTRHDARFSTQILKPFSLGDPGFEMIFRTRCHEHWLRPTRNSSSLDTQK